MRASIGFDGFVIEADDAEGVGVVNKMFARARQIANDPLIATHSFEIKNPS